MATSLGLFTATELGSLDLQVLLAIIRLGPHAYGKALWIEIGRVTDRAVCLSSVYSVLSKLERVRYVTRAGGEPGTKRGQRRTFCFFVTARGAESLKRSLAAIDALRSDVDVEVRWSAWGSDHPPRSARVTSASSVADSTTGPG